MNNYIEAPQLRDGRSTLDLFKIMELVLQHSSMSLERTPRDGVGSVFTRKLAESREL